jgi:DNA repair exonuclease SbcCD ATPase subunit
MEDVRQQAATLKTEIEQFESKLAALEGDIADLQRELDEFRLRYDKAVRPVAQRLEAALDAIEELRKERHLRSHAQHARPMESMWTPPPDYVPVETQFYKVWIEPKQNPEFFEPPPPPKTTIMPEAKTSLKKLYRMLARRYHPDFAADEADRAYRNRMMILINDAYAEKDVDALLALAEKDHLASPETPLAVLHIQKLEAQRNELSWHCSRLQGKYDDLLHCEMMRLKIDTALAQSKGRDLLKEMAERMEGEYWDCMERLDDLRRAASE